MHWQLLRSEPRMFFDNLTQGLLALVPDSLKSYPTGAGYWEQQYPKHIKIRRPPRKGGARLEVWTFWEFGHGVWVFLHLQCLHGVCIGWACALWLQRLCSVAVLDCSKRWRERVFWFAGWAVFGSCRDDVWVFLHLQCLHGVCTGWACALWLQRLCSVAVLDCFSFIYVDSKGNVKQFFGLRFGRFSARV